MARIDRIKQTQDIQFYTFEPKTKVEQFFANICQLQEDAMRILVNPRAFAAGEEMHDTAQLERHATVVSSYFIAKALYEIVQRNTPLDALTKTGSDQRDAIHRENVATLQTASFGVFYREFRQSWSAINRQIVSDEEFIDFLDEIDWEELNWGSEDFMSDARSWGHLGLT